MTEKTKPLINRDDVLRMAQEAGFEVHDRKQQARVGMDAILGIDSTEKLERFAAIVAAMVAAHEREACAKVCDAEAARAQFNWRSDVPSNQPFWNGAEQVVSGCAEAIRARGAA